MIDLFFLREFLLVRHRAAPKPCPPQRGAFGVQIASRLKKEDRGDRLDDAVDFHDSKQFDELFFG
jgi:hypothetical protein